MNIISVNTLLPDTFNKTNIYVLCYYPYNRMWCMANYSYATQKFTPCLSMIGNATHWTYLPKIQPH